MVEIMRHAYLESLIVILMLSCQSDSVSKKPLAPAKRHRIVNKPEIAVPPPSAIVPSEATYHPMPKIDTRCPWPKGCRRLTIDMRVNTAGQVISVSVDPSTPVDPAAIECILSVFRQWRFKPLPPSAGKDTECLHKMTIWLDY
jgi:hypothetical protein